MNTLIAPHFCQPDMTAHSAPRGKPPAPAFHLQPDRAE
jgi:hypothetical protein